MEDQTILDLFFARSEDAVTQTSRKYGGLCTAVVKRILPDSRDVEECLNDTWLHAWNSIPPTKPKSLRAYLARIARNKALDCCDYLRAEKRDSALMTAFEELEPFLPDGQDWNLEEKAAFSQCINNFLREQTEDNRRIFVRRYWYGESVAEIASALQMSQSKVKSSLQRTRNKLEAQLQKEEIIK